jgi:peptide deformylase
MAKRKIVILGEDEILRKKCRPVDKFDEKLHALLDDMAETMYDAVGAGLAAPQVGLLRRVATIDVGEGLIELVNPEIIERSGRKVDVEGCLSVPNRAGMVERPEKVTVRAQNRKGEFFEITAEGMLCKCLCHEIDHLDGIVYVDKMLEDVSDRFKMVTKGDK